MSDADDSLVISDSTKTIVKMQCALSLMLLLPSVALFWRRRHLHPLGGRPTWISLLTMGLCALSACLVLPLWSLAGDRIPCVWLHVLGLSQPIALGFCVFLRLFHLHFRSRVRSELQHLQQHSRSPSGLHANTNGQQQRAFVAGRQGTVTDTAGTQQGQASALGLGSLSLGGGGSSLSAHTVTGRPGPQTSFWYLRRRAYITTRYLLPAYLAATVAVSASLIGAFLALYPVARDTSVSIHSAQCPPASHPVALFGECGLFAACSDCVRTRFCVALISPALTPCRVPDPGDRRLGAGAAGPRCARGPVHSRRAGRHCESMPCFALPAF